MFLCVNVLKPIFISSRSPALCAFSLDTRAKIRGIGGPRICGDTEVIRESSLKPLIEVGMGLPPFAVGANKGARFETESVSVPEADEVSHSGHGYKLPELGICLPRHVSLYEVPPGIFAPPQVHYPPLKCFAMMGHFSHTRDGI